MSDYYYEESLGNTVSDDLPYYYGRISRSFLSVHVMIVRSLVLFRRHDLLCSDDTIRELYPTVFGDDIIIDDDDCHLDDK